MRWPFHRISALAAMFFIVSALLIPGVAAATGSPGPGLPASPDDRVIISLIDRARSCTGPPYPGSTLVTRGSYKIVVLMRSLHRADQVPTPGDRPGPEVCLSGAGTGTTAPDRTQPDTVSGRQPDSLPGRQGSPRQASGPRPGADQPKSPAAPDLSADEQRMLDLLNTARASEGLQPLRADADLTRLARMKARDMVDKGYFDHTSPTYGTPFSMIKAAGINYRHAGENLAGAPSVDTAHSSLMNSPGHRANIMSPNYTRAGIGAADGGPYGKMFVQLFTG